MGISLSPTYFEAAVVKEGDKSKALLSPPEISKRILFPHAHLGPALKDWIGEFKDSVEISKVYIGPHDPAPQINSFFSSLSDQQNSSHAAFLTTLGFESWLEVNHHLSKLHTLLERDLVFGVSERTNARGEVTVEPSDEDIDFLISKLNLNGIKYVAIGFLHSDLNPSNELRLKEKLTAQGFKVWISSEINETSIASQITKDEKERFLQTFLAAQSSFLIQDSVKKLEEHFPSIEFIQVHRPFYARGMRILKNQCLLYAGVDGLYLISSDRASSIELSPKLWAPIEKNFFSTLEFSTSQSNFDSGPMSFGRSTQVTPFDLLYALKLLGDVPGVNDKIHERSLPRIQDVLRAEAKPLGINDDELSKLLLGQLQASWLTELIHNNVGNEVLVAGPLSSAIFKLLKSSLSPLKLKRVENWNDLSSLTVLESD